MSGARIAWYWLGGTRPANTSASVPREMPLAKVRSSTWSGLGGGRASALIAPTPGAIVQNARASVMWACRRVPHGWSFASPPVRMTEAACGRRHAARLFPAADKRLQPQLGTVVRYALAVLHVQSAIVALLPLVRSGLRCLLGDLCLEGVARPAPGGKLLCHLRRLRHRHDLWLHPLQRGARNRKNEADRLIGCEANPVVPPGEAPVHGERVGSPIRLHHGAQRGNAVLRPIR